MKANELMIGDWVNFLIDIEGGDTENDPYNEVYQPLQVGSISSLDDVSSVFYGVTNDAAQLRPIPLTEEILEKIGFVRFYVNYVNYWKMQVDNSYIELRPTEGNMAIWLDYDKDNDGIYANYILPYPDNLHQLQHALRLCNIDKDIEP